MSNLLPAPLTAPLVAWLSRWEQPLAAALLIRALAWLAGDLHLEEAADSTFSSMRACFIRRLRPGARPVDDHPDHLVSPCDGQVMAAGPVTDGLLVQAKGLTYALDDLLADPALAAQCVGGVFVTLRLTPAMYHRFHAPDTATLNDVRHVPGAAWNVNPPTVRWVPRLYVRNTRAVLPFTLTCEPSTVVLVPVGAILVSSIVLPVVPGWEARDQHTGCVIDCQAPLTRGDEVGYFEHGSTVIVIASTGVALAEGIAEGQTVRMGQPLLRRQTASALPTHPARSTPSRESARETSPARDSGSTETGPRY
jgi:phosphatidylserine decarboxylase